MCVGSTCKAHLGQPCSGPEDCVTGSCVQCYFDNVACSDDYADAECLQECGSDPYYPYFAANCQ